MKADFKKTMKPNDTNNHRASLSFSANHKGPTTRLAGVSRLLPYLNTRTLALLMFVGFALLNTTHGKDAENNESAAITKNTETVGNSHRRTSDVRTEPTGEPISAALVLLQFTGRLVHAFTAALNDPSLIEYAKQQGTDIPDLQTTPCQGAERKTSTY